MGAHSDQLSELFQCMRGGGSAPAATGGPVPTEKEYGATTRKELSGDYPVFYATSWGTSADHPFYWFVRALNTHHDIYALPGPEGPRQKYMREWSRAERPPLVQYTEFMNDMGQPFRLVGDCFSYRAGQMPELLKIERYKNIPVVNLPRHPAPWLEYHVRWRASNMRLRAGVVDPLAWEWKSTCHALFEHLGLRRYTKADVEVWTAFQGMMQVNAVCGDYPAVPRHQPIETIFDDPEVFNDVVRYLSHGRIEFDRADLDRAYSSNGVLYQGEELLETDPRTLIESWPGWKVDAFRKLVSADAMKIYRSFGYDLFDLDREPPVSVTNPAKVSRPIFVSSIMKSGTVLLREILEQMTRLRAVEPEIGVGEPDYANEMLIEFEPGTFFSWHSTLTSRANALLRSAQAKNIFLVRNIYDVTLAIYTHLAREVDAGEGRATGGGDYFRGKSVEEALTLIIAGFTSPLLTWMGLAPLIRQMDSFMDLVESGQALLLSYEELTANKRQTVVRLLQHLQIFLPARRVEDILAATEPAAMRVSKAAAGLAEHMTRPEHKLKRDVFKPYHREMLNLVILANAPKLPERLRAVGGEWLLHP